ncbi:DMT family transporter [Nesterenkonia populi]|uniref:DMT family transporter n=1 Tax=Nesterenkonia populi TaxID=1591087 RepID=UPI0011BFA406|nr:DMT family transporter [Nesterenkonia populi]
MEICYAVCAAVMFGAGHYLSGTVSRRSGPLAVAYWTQYGVVLVAAALLLQQPLPQTWSIPALVWGVVAALGGVAGSLCLYAALSRATFTLAVGASTVTATVTPGLVAMSFLGEAITPVRLVLIGMAMLTVWLLVSQKRGDGTAAVVTSPLPVVTSSIPTVAAHGSLPEPRTQSRRGSAPLALCAGLGYAVELVGVAQIPGETFTQGLLAWAAASFVVMLVLVLARRKGQLMPRGRGGALVLVAGGLSATGMLLFHLSASGVGLATTSAIVAVYPAVPILLAVAILRERPARRGWAGLACAASVVALGAASTTLS